MNCRRTRRLLSRSIDRDLSAGEAGAVFAHLNGCRTCDRYHAALRKLGAELRQLSRPSGPRDLRREVTRRWAVEHAAIQAGRRDRPRGLAAGRSISWAMAGLAAMLLLLRFAHVIPVHRDRDQEMASARPGVSQQLHAGPPMPGTERVSERGAHSATGEGALLSRDLRSWTGSGVRGNQKPGSPEVRRTEHRTDLTRSAAGPSPDDLVFLNGNPMADVRRGALVTPADRAMRRATLLRGVPVRDDFVRVPLPRLADAGGTLIAPAVESYQREAAVVDARLFRKVTLGVKATALTDLCDQLRAETGIHLVAGRSVADEKVTVFCKETPLRDVMRQLSRPFGYAWLRSGKVGEYRYELTQDLRSQLLEEELRNRDRNAALLALDTEMQRYRKYLGLSPDEALARARTASPEEKKLLERYGGAGWGPAQLYFRLSPNDLSQMRAGKQVTFAAERSRAWQPDHQPLPPELARGTLQSERAPRIIERDGRLALGGSNDPEGLPPAQVPAARAMVNLRIEQSELGQFTFNGSAGCFISESVQPSGSFYMFVGDENLAVGISPSVLNPRNEETNAKLAHDPSLRTRVTVTPRSSCAGDLSPGPSPKRGGVTGPREGMPPPKGPQRHDGGDKGDKLPLPASGRGLGGEVNAEKVTTADMLEALHRATGRPIVADFYTRLYPLAEATAQNLPLFDALNRLADGMRLRWQKEGEWLQFRSASYFHDRLKEVPNRLLERWAASRREHGALTLDDLIEIGQLSDAQLDAAGMAEGAELCYGLDEWKLPRVQWLREQLHYLAEFTPAQREEAQRPAGLAFTKMTLRQQQAYLAHSWANVGLDEMASWTLRVEYTLPGEFQWVLPGWRKYLPSRVRERTQMAALQAARRIDPDVTEAQIVPTQLDLAICYAPAGENPPRARVARRGSNGMAP